MSQPVGLVHHDQYQQQYQYNDQDSEDDGLGAYDHYYNYDESDHGSATALAAQISDTLGASATGPPPAKDPSRLPVVTAQPPTQTQTQTQTHGVDEDQRQRQQSEQTLVSPQQSRLPSQLGQAAGHYDAQAHTHTEPSQPVRPESVAAHASSHSQNAPSPLHSPRSTRSHSLAASLASSYGNGSQSPIRRKPLSPTASPLAVRYSSKQFAHMPPLPPIPHDLQQPDSGFFSLNSPDLYDLDPKSPKTEDDPSLTTGPSLLHNTPLEDQPSDQDNP